MLDEGTSREALERALELIARGLASNDTLKLRLLAVPGLFDRLLALVEAESAALAARNHAAKALEALSGSAAAQRELVARGEHVRLIELMGRDSPSLFAKNFFTGSMQPPMVGGR